MFRMDVICAFVVLAASTAFAQYQAPQRAACATVAGHPQGCYCPQCFAQYAHPQGCYCPVCKPCPKPKPEAAPQPEGAYIRGPAAGEFAGESVSIGLTGFGFRFPALNFELPTLKLPSIVLYRRQPEMIVESSRAPYVERGVQEFGRLLGEPEAAPQPETTKQDEDEPKYQLMPMPCPYPYYQQPAPCNLPPTNCIQPPANGTGQPMPLAPPPTVNLSPREFQLLQQIQAEQSRIQRLESQLQQMQQTVEASLARLEGDFGDEMAKASYIPDANSPLPPTEPNPAMLQQHRAGVIQVSNTTTPGPKTVVHTPLEQLPETRQHAISQRQSAPASPRPQSKPGFRDRLRTMLPFGRH